MRSLFDELPTPERDRRWLPAEIRRAIGELKSEYPAFGLREIATICQERFDRSVSHHTVRAVLTNEPLPLYPSRRFLRYHETSDPVVRRRAVVTLYLDGWSAKAIAGYLETSRRTGAASATLVSPGSSRPATPRGSRSCHGGRRRRGTQRSGWRPIDHAASAPLSRHRSASSRSDKKRRPDEHIASACAACTALVTPARQGKRSIPDGERWHSAADQTGRRSVAMTAPGQDRMAGHVVLVTGGGGVIGGAIAQAFGRAGALVAVADLATAPLAETVAAIEQAGCRALAIPVDVTDRVAVEQMVARVEHELGPVELLVNNAGRMGGIGPLWEVDPDDWWQIWEVTVRGTMLCARAVLPGMVARRRGRIINVSSAAVLGPIPNHSAYPVAKTALTRLTEHLATDTREDGIAVFAITPGPVDTPMMRQAVASPWIGHLYQDVVCVPPELAAARCLELASGKADRLSGCYLQIGDDLDELIGRADEITTEDLYRLRIRGETATPTTPRAPSRSG
jgi:NAD(P)-dependent dehydrogenase (short-subunit alcohol dehydrogenase family)